MGEEYQPGISTDDVAAALDREALGSRLRTQLDGWIDSAVSEGWSADPIELTLANATAALDWSKVVGPRVDTSEAAARLGIDERTLLRRWREGPLISLDGRTTRWWPLWQFVVKDGVVKANPVVRPIVGAFRDAIGDRTSDFTIVSWATTPNSSLNWVTPAGWMNEQLDDEMVIAAAIEDASAMAR